MSEIRGMAALQTWCRRATAGYPGVRVDNLTTSFRDGMAFCALIHHYRPDLIDFDSLSKENVYKNNELAFRVAEQELGIPALLDPEDMVSYQIPDRLSVSTYLAQFYHVFGAKSGKASPSTPAKRLADKVPTSPISPPKKVFSEEFLNVSEPASASLLRRREICAICQLPVFLAERLKIGAKLLHRTCFRCGRCKAQLTPASCYETENGEHCCEVCPDEEPTPALSPATTDSSSSLSPVSTIQAPIESTSKSLVGSEEVTQRSGEGMSSGDSEVRDVSEVTQRTRDARPSSVKKLISRFDTGARGDFLSRELQMQSDRGLSFIETAAKESVKVAEPDPSLVVSVTGQPNAETPSKAGVCSDLVAGVGAENDESETVSNSPTVDALELPMGESHSRNSDANLDIDVEATLKLSDSEIVNKLHSSLNDLSENILYPKNPPKTPLSDMTYSVDPTDNPFETPEGRLPELKNLENPFAPECHPPPEILVEPDENPLTCSEEPSASPESSLSSGEKPATSPEKDKPHDKIRTPFEEPDKEAEENETGGIQEVAVSLPVPSPRRRGKEKSPLEDYPEDLNPFDDDLETDTQGKDPVVLETSGPSDTSLNPFGEEEDLDETNPFAVEDDVRSTPKSPVPTPRKSLMSPESHRSFVRSPSPSFSVRSSVSSYGKKRLAPPPPGTGIDSRSISPVSTISRYRKDRRAPPPPKLESGNEPQEAKIEPSPLPDLVSMNTTPRRNSQEPDVISDENCRKSDEIFRKSGEAVGMPEQILSGDEIEKSFETEGSGDDFRKCEIREGQGTCHKSEKDKLNENRKSSSSDSSQSKSYTRPNKDSYGQWKRKKAPAPPRPLPQKRQLRKLPMRQIQQELSDLEVQQSEMERQGVALERQIRAITESSSAEDDNSSQSLKLEAEDLILQLFDIVNEKNELLRRQTELMYLKRQQRLEEEYIELEYQIRCLLDKSENCRTDEDKSREDELIQRLVLVVERRAEIVDCLELERRRGEEEDTSIKCHLEAYNLKHDQPSPSPSPETPEQPKPTKMKFKSPAKLLMKVSEHKKKTKPEGENQLDKKTKSKWFKK